MMSFFPKCKRHGGLSETYRPADFENENIFNQLSNACINSISEVIGYNLVGNVDNRHKLLVSHHPIQVPQDNRDPRVLEA